MLREAQQGKTWLAPPAALKPRPAAVTLLVVGVVVALGWVVSWIPAYLFTGTSTNLLTWIIVSCVVALAPVFLLPREARRWSELGVMYALVWCLTFGVASLVWIGSSSVVAGLVVLPSTLIASALGLTTLGIGSFWLGYLVQRRHRPSLRGIGVAAWRLRWPLVITVYAIGLAARLVLIRVGLFGYSINYSLGGGTIAEAYWAMPLILLGMTVDVATYAAVAWTWHDPRHAHRLVAAFMVAGLVLTGIVAGGKGTAIGPLFAVTLIYISYRGRIPRSFVVGGVTLLLIVLPGSQLFRSQAGGATALEPGRHLASLRAGLDLEVSEQASIVADWLASRPQSVDQIALILAQTPHPYPYQYGSLWGLSPIYNVVPRAIWPSKPILALEYDFDHKYRRIPPGLPGNTGVTLPGDMYINFGTPGVVVGMFLWGLVLAWVSAHWKRIDRPDRLVLFVTAASYVLLPDRSFTSMLLVLPRILLVTWVVTKWSFARAGEVVQDGGTSGGVAVQKPMDKRARLVPE